jgi:small subunit ribosomal protein S11
MKRKKTGKQKKVTSGKIFVRATFNNTLINITDSQGNTICWGSAGAAGFKGARKATPFAATTAIDTVIKKGIEKGLQEADLYIKGPGTGRQAVLRTLQTIGLKVNSINDVTPIPHNGVRPPKRRRV